MKAYVFDAKALLRYVRNGEGAGKVDALLKRAASGDVHVSMSVVNLGEVLYILAKQIGTDKALEYLNSFRLVIEKIATDVELRGRRCSSFSTNWVMQTASRQLWQCE